MAPIHETDIAEHRWSSAEWENYELWEKVELRLRRRRWFWIGTALVAFFVLSAVPVVLQRWPKWSSLAAARALAREVSAVKREASVNHSAFRVRFTDLAQMEYVVEKGESCSTPVWHPVRTGLLGGAQPATSVLTPEEGAARGIPGLARVFCYDYLAGNSAMLRSEALIGFGLVPAKDLAVNRFDRVSILLLGGPSAEVNFE